MNFNSRETYLAAVDQWKTEYADLSTKIRQKKLELKSSMREQKSTWRLHLDLNLFQAQANSLLEERKEGKIEAQKQWLAQFTKIAV